MRYHVVYPEIVWTQTGVGQRPLTAHGPDELPTYSVTFRSAPVSDWLPAVPFEGAPDAVLDYCKQAMDAWLAAKRSAESAATILLDEKKSLGMALTAAISSLVGAGYVLDGGTLKKPMPPLS